MKLSTTKKDFKKGQTIRLIPLGNRVKSGNIPLKTQISSGVIEKVGLKNITLTTGESFNIYGEYDRYNSGYLPFLSKEKAIEYLEIKHFINSKLQPTEFNTWKIEDLKKLYNLVKSIELKENMEYNLN